MRKLLLASLLLASCGRDLVLPEDPGAPEPLSVESTSAQVAPRGAVRLKVSGGAPPYAIQALLHDGNELQPRAELENGDELAYQAGDAGGVVDEVIVTDTSEQSVIVRFVVGPSLIVIPAYAAVNASATLRFQVTGGQAPYGFALDEALGGGASSSITRDGTFTAGYEAGSVRVTVTDALGTAITARVSIGPGLSIFPAQVSLTEGGSASFEAFGGNPPYTFTLVAPYPPGVALDPATRTVSVPLGLDRQGLSSFGVEVSDGGPRPARATVLLQPSLAPPRDPGELPPGTSVDLEPTGGTAPYTVRFAWGGNVSGGRASGTVYQAGPNPHVTDHLEIEDANGRVVNLDVRVGDLRLERSRYEGVASPDLDPTLGVARMRAGHVFLPGAHLRIDEDGALGALPFPSGRLHDVIEAEGTGGFLAVARASTTSNFVYLYGAGPDGFPQIVGGGRFVSGASFFANTVNGLSVGVAGGLGCTAGWSTLGGFVAGGDATCFTANGGGLMVGDGWSLWTASPRRLQRFPVLPLGGSADRTCFVSYMEAVHGAMPVNLRGDVFGGQAVSLGQSARSLAYPELATCVASGDAIELDLPDFSLEARLIGAPAAAPGERASVYVADGPRAYEVKLAAGDLALTAPVLVVEGDPIAASGDLDGDLGFDALTLDDLGTFRVRYDVLEERTGNGNRFRAGPASRVTVLPADIDGDARGDVLALSGGHVRPLLSVENDGPALALLADLVADDLARVIGLFPLAGAYPASLVAVDADGVLVRRELHEREGFLPPEPLSDLSVSGLGVFPVEILEGQPDLLVPRADIDGRLTGADVVRVDAGGSSTTPVLELPAALPVTEVKAGDVTGDGVPDLVALGACTVYRCGAPVVLYRGQGDRGSYRLGSGETIHNVSAPGHIALDTARGKVIALTRIPALFTTDYYPLDVEVITPGAGTARSSVTIDLEGIYTAGPDMVQLAEVDGQPGPELLVPANDSGLHFDPGNLVRVFSFTPGGTLDLKGMRSHELAPHGASVSWLARDVDGDGLADLLAISGPPPGKASGPRVISILRSDGRSFVR